MTTQKQTPDVKGYVYTEVAGKITVTHQGSVNLNSLTTLPDGTSFTNRGCVYLDYLTTLPDGTSFANQGSVNLYSLTTLPDGTSFANQGGVNLYSLTTLPDGTSFNNRGHVNLYSLTTLPDGTSFANQGSVNLRSLTNETQNYQGEQITIRNIDGYTMLIDYEKITKGITVCKARYFGGGKIKDLKKCYVAKVGNHWAHGETAKEAIQDANDKATLGADVEEVVAEIKRTVMVTIAQYRAITGACREGCRQFLQSIGKPDATELPLADVMQQVKGHYGFIKFKEVINNY